jgi:transposase
MDVHLPALPSDDAARTTARKSGRLPPVEVLVRADRRRRWSAERKREIVAESLETGRKPGEVARRHGISTGQLYTWRQEMFGVQRALTRSEPPRFAPVEVAPEAAGATAALSGPEMLAAPVRPAGLSRSCCRAACPCACVIRVIVNADSGFIRASGATGWNIGWSGATWDGHPWRFDTPRCPVVFCR